MIGNESSFISVTCFVSLTFKSTMPKLILFPIEGN